MSTDCCKETDDFDLCPKCRDAGNSCACSDNQMSTMQKCVAGDVLVSEKGDARRRLATVSEIRCLPCQRLITQGRYYRKSSFSLVWCRVLTSTLQIVQSAAKKKNRLSTCVKTAIARGRHVARLIHTDFTCTSGPTLIGHTQTLLLMESGARLASLN